jgi:acyl-CoA hydrolase
MATVGIHQLKDVFARLTPGCRVVASGNFATPMPLIDALAESQEEFTLHMLNAHGQLPDRAGVTLETAFVGPAMRGRSNLRYVPCRLSMVPWLFAGPLPPEVVLLHTSLPREGRVSLGLEVNVLPAAIEAARARGGIVVAMMNPRMPYLYGDAEVLLEHLDYTVEIDAPLLSVDPREPDPTSAAIGANVADMIDDHATLQMGIGAVPDSVLHALKGHRGLTVWSEMFSDGVLALEQAGALSRSRPIVSSFIFGSEELYAWVDGNPRVRLLRTEKTNDPALIARHPRMTSVNSALQVDLYGQANASTVRGAIYSGFGGQTDFIVGAMHAPDGKAFIALPSWHPKSGTSTIVGQLDCRVTSFQQTAVVTEQGVAHLWGRSQGEQAVELIERAAHPEARAHLRESAQRAGLLH